MSLEPFPAPSVFEEQFRVVEWVVLKARLPRATLELFTLVSFCVKCDKCYNNATYFIGLFWV